MSSNVRDMTKGSPVGLILMFALPLMLGNVCQQLYVMVDTAVVGKFIGVEALAAVGSTGWPAWLVLSVAQGLTQGFGIMIAQAFGAGDKELMHKSYMNSIYLSIAITAVLMVVSQIIIMPMLRLLGTEETILDMCALYIRIYYAGLPLMVAYNLFACVLRALGNSKTPLYAMISASFTNIALDLIFVLIFKWGIGGAAFATVIAQGVSAAFCLVHLLKIDILKAEKDEKKADLRLSGQLLKLGTPVAFQNIVICVGGMVVQKIINSYGLAVIAGFAAMNQLYGLLEIAATSFGFSLTTYVGQNIGAKQYARVRHGTNTGAVLAFIVSLIIAALLAVFAKPIMKMFIDISTPLGLETLDIAVKYLYIQCATLFFLYLLYIYRSALQGMGDTFIPMVSGIAELFMRVGVALFLPLVFADGIFFAESAAWFGAAVLLCGSYYAKVHKLPRTNQRQPL